MVEISCVMKQQLNAQCITVTLSKLYTKINKWYN
jgi:hypothetical protein